MNVFNTMKELTNFRQIVADYFEKIKSFLNTNESKKLMIAKQKEKKETKAKN